MSLQSSRERFADELTRCADSRSAITDVAPLRNLQHFVQGVLYEDDRELRALAFIIDEWIKDYYLNFAGDVVVPAWEAVDSIRQDLLQQHVPNTFRELANALTERTDIFKPIAELIAVYIDSIKAANREVEHE